MSSSSELSAGRRAAITLSTMLATLLQSLDTTIANIALPHIQASVSASQDQISWVLTSYIVAAAIMTPPSGFLARRFGTKRLYLISVAGFVVASMLCGIAQSLMQIVLFRITQGIFGAAIVPLSQAVLLSSYPKEKQGSVMGLWGLAVTVGPVLGPILGGWLTDSYSWRWVFYINLPIGILAFLGISTSLRERPTDNDAQLDWFGFAALSIGIAAMQVLLDRGEQLDWFGSSEIVTEGIIAASMFYLFAVRTFTAKAPFFPLKLLRDRNFMAGSLFNVIVGLTYYASLALLPTYLQNLMNYPVVTAGLVLGPQGMGTMAAMVIAGRLVGRVDTRILLALGLGMASWAFYQSTLWTPDVSAATIMVVGVVQGGSIGFLFVPLSVVSLSTLPSNLVTDGAGFFTLVRNLGSSSGIAIVTALVVRNTQVNHATIAAHVSSVNRAFANPVILKVWDPVSAAGRAALDSLVTQQAQIIAYIDDYKLLMVATLATAPLLLFFRKAPRGRKNNQAGGAHL
jgi:MFS transporter, DHA2 family, multidrug resistance protein